MTIRRLALLLVLVLIAPVLVACGGDDDGGDGGDASSQSAALSQSYDEAGLSFSYPDGWVASSDAESALIANSQEVLDMAGGDQEGEIPDGGQAYTILGFSAPAESGIEPAALVEVFASEAAAEEGTEMGEAEDVTIGEATGVKVTVTDSESGGEGAFYILRLNDQVVVAVIGLASAGDYDDALTQSIAATVSFTPPTE